MTIDEDVRDTVTESGEGDLRAVAKGGAANLFGSGISGVATFGLTVLVARALSHADAGVFFASTSLFLLVTAVGQLGTTTGVVYFVARARALGRSDSIPRLLRSAMRPVVILGTGVALLTILAAPPIAQLVAGHHAGPTADYLRVLAIFVPIAGMETVWLAGLRGFGSMRANVLIEGIGRPLVQLALVAAVLTKSSPTIVGLAWGVPFLAAAGASYVSWRRVSSSLPPPSTTLADDAELGGFWRFTGPRALTSVLQVLMQRFDIVLVAALAGVVPAAVYTAATRFIVVGQMAVNSFTQATQPRLSQTIARQDREGTNNIYQLSTAWLILLTWPLYLMLIVFHHPLLGVFGHGYDAGGAVLVILSLSMLLATGCGLVDVVLSMAGHTSWNLANAALALTCNLGLDLWLIPTHGVLGAAVGWACAIAVRNLSALTQVGLALRLHPFARCTLLACGLTVFAFGAIPLVARIALGDTWLALVVGGLLGTLVWVAGVARGRSRFALHAFGARRRHPSGPARSKVSPTQP